MRPDVSLIMATYNRGDTIRRAIDSVVRQTWPHWELIIVDDGSTDDTADIVASYAEERIRFFRLATNCGPGIARNRGLDAIRGKWFSLLDSDDELLPEALEVLLNAARTVASGADALTCNCIDSETGKFTGQGVEEDQWITFETLVKRLRGEHWGITKTSLLGRDRFPVDMTWGEDALWYRLSARARRYYLHRGLRIYHKDATNRLSAGGPTLSRWLAHYIAMGKDEWLMSVICRWRRRDFHRILRRVIASAVICEGTRQGFALAEKYGGLDTFALAYALRAIETLKPGTTKRIMELIFEMKRGRKQTGTPVT